MFAVLLSFSSVACGVGKNGYGKMKNEPNSGIASEVDFGGRIVKILTDSSDAVEDLCGSEILGETVNVAIYERNRDV